MAFDMDQFWALLNAAKTKGQEFADIAREKGGEFAGNAKERGMGIAGLAVEKTKEAAAIAKLSMALASEKEALKKAYVELGREFYESNRAEADGILAQLCEEVDVVNARIEGLQSELDDAKAALRSSPESADFEEVVSEAEESEAAPESEEQE